MVALDVGTGDGLIGLAALGRLGASGAVIFSGISDALLGHVHALELHVDVEAGGSPHAIGIDALLDSAPSPLAPAARESIAAALTPDEQERFVAGLRRAVEAGDRLRRSAVAYLVASKPG